MVLPPLASLLPFEAAARLGSITKAGEELGLTQAAISRQIRALEDHLGTQMFERRNRAVYLTEEGRAFSQTLTQSLQAVANHSHELRHTRDGGEVLLRSQLCEGLYWLMPRLSEFYQKHPDIGVRLITSTRPMTETTERFDLALQTVGRDCSNGELAFAVPDDVFPICSPKYLERLAEPVSFERLQDYRLLHHSGSPPDWLDWDRWFERVGAEIHVQNNGEVYDSYPLMMQAAIEGHGIALGWKRASERLLGSGALVRPFNELVSVPDSFGVYKPKGWKPKPGTSEVLDWIKGELV
ncbi:LysR substrate-binding domain-containing protein [Ruegeria meonggei]|uniref:Glycine cleavage system transcriptional activator n=1 Tax=Ruegeria meonggei TaxID=1446476 RepID=A0A1X6YWC1_9RHOB|nr:LysR substrate-binding domain-containing protein [Ruegeria meonggei]SLN33543.1 Glycine cleavage system transcriptional activator [Ruegeria meonggei]